MAESDIKLGAGKLYYDSGGEWVYMGETDGSTTMTYSPEYFDITTAQGGSSIKGKINMGQNATIEVVLSEYNKENIQRAMPLATIYTDGDESALGFGGGINSNVLDSALKLKFHPMNTEAAGNTDDITVIGKDFTFWKAVSATDVALAFAYDDTRKIPITFQIFKDSTVTTAYDLFVVGDTDIVGITQTAPALIGTLPANGAAAVALDAKIYVVLDQQLVDNKLAPGDVGLCLASTGVAVSCTETYGKTISQLFDSDVTVENPSAVASTTEFTLATPDIIASNDILNGLSITITEGSCTHTTTISDYTSLGVVTLALACTFTFTTAAEYKISGGFIELEPAANLTTAVDYVIVVGGVQGKNLKQKTGVIAYTITTT